MGDETIDNLRINRACRRPRRAGGFELPLRVRRKRLDHQASEDRWQKRHAMQERPPIFASQYPIEDRVVLLIDRDQMVEALRDAPRIGGGLPIELLRVQMAEENLCVAGDGFGFIVNLWECEGLIVHSYPYRRRERKPVELHVLAASDGASSPSEAAPIVSLATISSMSASAFAAISYGV